VKIFLFGDKNVTWLKIEEKWKQIKFIDLVIFRKLSRE
jgi:hypothetical protein